MLVFMVDSGELYFSEMFRVGIENNCSEEMDRIDKEFTKLKEQHNVDALAHLGFTAAGNQNVKYITTSGAFAGFRFVGETR